LLEGFNIHGTGNGTNNKIIGNSSDNIIDGVTGVDVVGGVGRKDTYQNTVLMNDNRFVFVVKKPYNENQYYLKVA